VKEIIFLNFQMLEDETLNEFFGILSEISNSMINLGKKVFDTKLIRKVMRSLPKRFRMKTTAIKLCIDLNTMKVEELVGAFQTYEFSFLQPRKNKDLALRTLKNSDEDSPDEEELAFIARRFYRNEHRICKRFGKPKEST
jgi:hypothetical protein